METKNPAAIPDKREDQKKELVLLAWLSFLIIGGGLLALYYAEIGYLPDIEWYLSLIYLAVVSFIGGAYGILQALAIFLPGYIWSEALVRDSQVGGDLCHTKENDLEPSVYEVFLHLGVPFLICLLVSHVALYWGIWPYLMVTAIFLIAISIFIWQKFPSQTVSRYVWSGFLYLWEVLRKKGDKKDSSGKAQDSTDVPVARKCKYVFWFDLSVLLNQIAVLLIYYISDQPKGWPYINISCVCIFVVLLSNHIVAVSFWKNSRQAVAASLTASLLLLVAANQFTHLPERIMALYGFGECHKFQILVNDDGARIIEGLGLTNIDCGQRNNLCGAEILSSVGSEYLIKLGDVSFTLPKSTVMARSEKKSVDSRCLGTNHLAAQK